MSRPTKRWQWRESFTALPPKGREEVLVLGVFLALLVFVLLNVALVKLLNQFVDYQDRRAYPTYVSYVAQRDRLASGAVVQSILPGDQVRVAVEGKTTWEGSYGIEGAYVVCDGVSMGKVSGQRSLPSSIRYEKAPELRNAESVIAFRIPDDMELAGTVLTCKWYLDFVSPKRLPENQYKYVE